MFFFGQFSKLIENNPNFEVLYEKFCEKWKKILKDEFDSLFNANGESSDFDFYMRRMLNDKTKYEVKRDDFFERTKKLLAI